MLKTFATASLAAGFAFYLRLQHTHTQMEKVTVQLDQQAAAATTTMAKVNVQTKDTSGNGKKLPGSNPQTSCRAAKGAARAEAEAGVGAAARTVATWPLIVGRFGSHGESSGVLPHSLLRFSFNPAAE